MRKYGFFEQHAIPLDLTEIGGFDVLGIPETRIFHPSGGYFETSCMLTATDITHETKKESGWRHNVVADIKAEKMKAAVEELRILVCEEFTKQLKILSDYRSYFYIPKERIVQFVSLPVSFRDLAPGDTSISFRIFTERFLGEIEDA